MNAATSSSPRFGLRKLVDVGARSIYSSPFQDPTTCVQSINAIHDILRRLARREFPSGRHHDGEGRVRLVERVDIQPASARCSAAWTSGSSWSRQTSPALSASH